MENYWIIFTVPLFWYFLVPGSIMTVIMSWIYCLIGKKKPDADRFWLYPLISAGIVAMVYAPFAAFQYSQYF